MSRTHTQKKQKSTTAGQASGPPSLHDADLQSRTTSITTSFKHNAKGDSQPSLRLFCLSIIWLPVTKGGFPEWLSRIGQRWTLVQQTIRGDLKTLLRPLYHRLALKHCTSVSKGLSLALRASRPLESSW